MQALMKKALVSVCAGMALSTAWAEPETYVFDTQHTYPNFEVGHMGYSVRRGWFEKTEGTVTIDRAAGKGEMLVEIDPASINTGLPIRDNIVRSDKFGFLDVLKFPKIVFRSNQFEFEGQELKKIKGDLTIKGVTKPVELTMVSMRCGEHPMKKVPMCGGEARTSIQKKDYGEFGGGILGDEIRIALEFEAYRK